MADHPVDVHSASILLIDDHPALRSGLKHLISLRPQLHVVAEASSGQEGLQLAAIHDPDLILLDWNMPEMNGLETLQRLREQPLSGRVVVFTVSNFELDVTEALKRGADGYLLKDMEPEALLDAIEQAISGQLVISPDLAQVLASGLRRKEDAHQRDLFQLTARERQTLALVAEGKSNKMIANEMGISEGTVKVHVKNLLRKLNFRSRVEATVWMLEQGNR